MILTSNNLFPRPYRPHITERERRLAIEALFQAEGDDMPDDMTLEERIQQREKREEIRRQLQEKENARMLAEAKRKMALDMPPVLVEAMGADAIIAEHEREQERISAAAGQHPEAMGLPKSGRGNRGHEGTILESSGGGSEGV